MEISTSCTPVADRTGLEWNNILLYINRIERGPNRAKYIKYLFRDYYLSLTGKFPGLKSSYLYCRLIDDIADGDIILEANDILGKQGSVEEIIDQQSRQIVSGNFESNRLSQLLRLVIVELLESGAEHNEVKSTLEGFLASMKIEYQRRVGRLIFSRNELHQIHTNSSGFAHDIALISGGSKNRSKDTQLPLLIGRVDALRDMTLDLTQGIINIPLEYFPKNLAPKSPIHFQEIMDEGGVISGIF